MIQILEIVPKEKCAKVVRSVQSIGSSIKLYFHKKEFNDAPRKFHIC